MGQRGLLFGITTIFIVGLSVQAELPQSDPQPKGSMSGMFQCPEVARQTLNAVLSTGCDDVSAENAARLLLAEEELGAEQPYAVLIGDDGDRGTEDLWRVMLSKLPASVRRERFTSADAARRGAKINYPQLSRPAAFLCVKKRCSVPLFTTAELSERIASMITDRRESSYEDH